MLTTIDDVILTEYRDHSNQAAIRAALRQQGWGLTEEERRGCVYWAIYKRLTGGKGSLYQRIITACQEARKRNRRAKMDSPPTGFEFESLHVTGIESDTLFDEMLSILPLEERSVIQRKFVLGMSLREISREDSVSYSRIHRIYTNGIERLRADA